MGVTVDVSYKSLNKFTEELCGDKVEILKTADSDIMILADGMGSGVKANILATLTSKILGTMFLNGATLEECVETIVQTLPVCQVRHVAYATFSILQVFHNGDAYLVEFDNPGCIFVRDGQLVKIPENIRVIKDKKINEYRFRVRRGDCFVLMSDGTIHAGVGQILNFGWTWESMAEYAVKEAGVTSSSSRLAASLSKACDDLYLGRPGDDTTVAVMRIIDRKEVHLLTGPPQKKEDDKAMVEAFLSGDARRIVCGGTSATIVSRETGKELLPTLDYVDPQIPPIAFMEGIDLVTEGVLTLNRAVTLLKRYVYDQNINENFFLELDKPNGGSMVAKMLIEDCTDLHLYIGKAINVAHQNPNLPFDLGIRQNLMDQLKKAVADMGRHVEVTYY